MIKKTAHVALVAAAVLFAGFSAPALAQSYGPLHPGEPTSVNRAPQGYGGRHDRRMLQHGRDARDAFARFPDGRSLAAPYAPGRSGVIGKGHGPNGW